MNQINNIQPPEPRTLRFRRLPPQYQNELRKLLADKPEDGFISQTDWGILILTGLVGLAAALGLVAYWHFRIHQTFGTIEATTGRLTWFCFFSAGLWLSLFSVYRQVRTWRSNAYCLASFGLVRVYGSKVRIIPYSRLGAHDVGSGPSPTRYYDPATGRTSFCQSAKERRRSKVQGKSPKLRYPSPIGKSAFLDAEVKGHTKPEKILFPDNKLEARPLFDRNLQQRIESAGVIEPPLPKGKKRQNSFWAGYAFSLPFVMIVSILLVRYCLIPAHNKSEINSYCRYYLFNQKSPVYENLTDAELHLSDYLEYFDHGPYKDMVARRLLGILEKRLKDMDREISEEKTISREMLVNYDLLKKKHEDLKGLFTPKAEVEP